ncbi:MAG: GNAT family N-acetyltransferase [Acidobacteriota bacterium]|nr:GNAT family N-acetyltransferase [Acidobacteriota bacterium]
MRITNNEGIAIRAASAADRDFVLALADRLVSFDVPAFRSKAEFADGDRRALAEWFRELKPDEALFIAELNGHSAGCAYLVTLVDFFTERPHAHVSVLAVTAEAEGRGVGSALLDHCQAWARQRGSDHLTLNALVTNARARGLYERRGFAGEYIRYVLPL